MSSSFPAVTYYRVLRSKSVALKIAPDVQPNDIKYADTHMQFLSAAAQREVFN